MSKLADAKWKRVIGGLLRGATITRRRPGSVRRGEQRIRTRVGEDPRTLGMQRLNVEVNDGVAEIRGIAPTEDAKAAVQDIASNTEGVREVRMMMTVGG